MYCTIMHPTIIFKSKHHCLATIALSLFLTAVSEMESQSCTSRQAGRQADTYICIRTYTYKQTFTYTHIQIYLYEHTNININKHTHT